MGTCYTSNTGKGMVLGDVCYIEYRHKPFEDMYGCQLEPDHSFADVLRLINENAENDVYISDTTDDDMYLLSESEICTLALAEMFEEKYGYPAGSFRSVVDYEGMTMLFCNVQWPPKEYCKAIAEMTEEKLERQLQEFLVELTGDAKFETKSLETCNEEDKE